jgi:hypothetical protein
MEMASSNKFGAYVSKVKMASGSTSLNNQVSGSNNLSNESDKNTVTRQKEIPNSFQQQAEGEKTE